MARYSESYLEIRRLRKKLRQIEHLETLDRPLDQFENDKVQQKLDFRSRLQELLAAQAENPDLDDAAEDDDDEGGEDTRDPLNSPVYERSDECSSHCEPAGNGDKCTTPKSDARNDHASKIIIAVENQANSTDDSKLMETTSQLPPVKKLKTQHASKEEQSIRKKRKFHVRRLEGHSDLVNCISVLKDKFVSGSRDTTLKVWSTLTGLEETHLGGHTGSVTAALLTTDAEKSSLAHDLEVEESSCGPLVISGSSDCSICIWNSSSGECLKSLYVFHPVTSLALIFVQSSCCLLIGTGGGKLEMWSLQSDLAMQSFRTEQEQAITGIQVENNYVYTCSASGLLCVYELRGESLHLVYESENVRIESGAECIQRSIHSMAVSRQKLYYGDDGMNVKVLDWEHNVVHKLSHHSMEFGVTDAIQCVAGCLMLAAGYDLDNGVGYVNVRELPEENYLYTLCEESIGRILSLSCYYDPAKDQITLVTGGTELCLWCQADGSTRPGSEDVVVSSQFVPQFSRTARHSDIESESDNSDIEMGEEMADDPPLPWQHREEEDVRKGWLSYCTIL